MTSAWRAVAGFFVGALVTLVAHPASRPFLLSATQHISAPRLEHCFDDHISRPAPPRNLEGASQWLQLASERAIRHQELRPNEVRTLLGIARHAEELEPRNAFWFQEEAVLLASLGRSSEAYDAWARAARCDRWNDYQLQRLMEARARLADLIGAKEAWQLAYVYDERSDAATVGIERYGRALLGHTGLSTPADLRVRYITLLNGELIRYRTRSISSGLLGANLVELSAYPSDLVHTPSPKRLWVAQSKFLNDLRQIGIPDAEGHARIAFGKNESWRALAQAQDPRDLVENLSAGAVLSDSLIGACAFSALIGIAVWLIGCQVSGRLAYGRRLAPAFVILFSASLAALSTWLTHDFWAGLVGALSGAFLYVGPVHARRARPEDLGPLFALLLIIIAGLCGAALVAFAIAKTAAAESILPFLGIPTDFYRTPLLLGMACIFFSLALTAVPIWAMVQRIGTPHVFGLALRKFGAYLGFGSLAVGIVLGPIAVYADNRIGQTLQQLVENEPIFYFQRYI
jgi:hypothetical protein